MSPTQTQELPLALEAARLKSVSDANALYEAALRPATPLREGLKVFLTALGLCGLTWLAWAEPFSAGLAWPARLAVTVLRGVLFVEAFGYAYHRWFQHLGWWTRRARVFRRNQRYHWIHHMILYPIGRFYRRDVPYVSSEGGLGLSWAGPAVGAIALAVATMGPRWETLVFVTAMASYAYFVVDDVHSRFHLERHSYQGFQYFRWLEDIHVLHHWDQRYNFTIVHPAMDWLFGTYLAPRTHRRELDVALRDEELTVSDLINWRYLLLEANPVEYAAFISEARRHPRSLRKIGRLLEVLQQRLSLRPADPEARLLRHRAAELVNQVRGSWGAQGAGIC